MKLEDVISKTLPRERSGGPTSNRYNFQKDWSVLRILEIHDTTPDYYLVFEHFDDVVQYDSNVSPKKMSFFQVKTKDRGEWSFSELFKPSRSSKNYSIMSLLLDHIATFESGIESLNFVTNAKISNRLLDKNLTCNDSRFNLSAFNSETKLKINEILKSQTPIEIDDIIESITCFTITPLHLASHRDTIIGSIVTYLNNKYGSPGINPAELYRSIYEEIDARSSCETTPRTLPEICKQKGISKNDVARLFERYYCTKDWDKEWESIASTLRIEGVPWGIIQAIKSAWKQIELQFISGSDLATETLQRSISQHLPGRNSIIRLADTLSDVFEIIERLHPEYDEHYIKALILRTIHEIQEHTCPTEEP